MIFMVLIIVIVLVLKLFLLNLDIENVEFPESYKKLPNSKSILFWYIQFSGWGRDDIFSPEFMLSLELFNWTLGHNDDHSRNKFGIDEVTRFDKGLCQEFC